MLLNIDHSFTIVNLDNREEHINKLTYISQFVTELIIACSLFQQSLDFQDPRIIDFGLYLCCMFQPYLLFGKTPANSMYGDREFDNKAGL